MLTWHDGRKLLAKQYEDARVPVDVILNDIDKYLLKQFEQMDKSTYSENASYIESQLQKLEEEIVGEKGVIEKELSPYETLLEQYPWIEEPKYAFMYSIPNNTFLTGMYNRFPDTLHTLLLIFELVYFPSWSA